MKAPKHLRIGSRQSVLAVAQANIVIDAIHTHHPDIQMELVTFTTKGDKELDKPLTDIGGKGLFIKELEKALWAGDVDLCVHSYKDMPMDLAEVDHRLPVVALSPRANPRDALVLPLHKTSAAVTGPIGSSSARRMLQLAELYPYLDIVPVRGNVITRLQKLDDGHYGALVLALAGLARLDLAHRATHIFSPDEMLPAASQGILAVQGRAGGNYDYLRCFHSEVSHTVSLAERAFVRALEGGCTAPTAAYATLDGGQLTLRGLFCPPGTGIPRKATLSGPAADAEALGIQLAKLLK